MMNWLLLVIRLEVRNHLMLDRNSVNTHGCYPYMVMSDVIKHLVNTDESKPELVQIRFLCKHVYQL